MVKLTAKQRQRQSEEFERKCRAWNLMQRRVDHAWAAAPDSELSRLLLRQLVGRAWRLLEGGNAECADRLLELLPSDIREGLLHYEFETEEFYPPTYLSHSAQAGVTRRAETALAGSGSEASSTRPRGSGDAP